MYLNYTAVKPNMKTKSLYYSLVHGIKKTVTSSKFLTLPL